MLSENVVSAATVFFSFFFSTLVQVQRYPPFQQLLHSVFGDFSEEINDLVGPQQPLAANVTQCP